MVELLRSGHPVQQLWIARGRRGASVAEIEGLAKARGVPLQWVESSELSRRAQTDAHQGVLALAAPLPDYQLEDLLAQAERRGEPPLLVICAHIQDPHNLGALLRSAEAAGAHGAVIPKRRSAPLGATVFKSSAGAMIHLPVARVPNVGQAVVRLQQAGVRVAAADPEGSLSYDRWDFTGPVAIVLGGEERGVPPLVRRRCDDVLCIPMQGRTGSLNVSVAGGILLFEAARQRRAAGSDADRRRNDGPYRGGDASRPPKDGGPAAG